MCGIIALLSRPTQRSTPSSAEVLKVLDAAMAAADTDCSVTTLAVAARAVGEADQLLRGVPGVLALVAEPELADAIIERLGHLDDFALSSEAAIEAGTLGAEVEEANAALVSLRDGLWAIRKDRLRTAVEVSALAGRNAGPAAVTGFMVVQQALSALDRLEVRGRDSAGVHLYVWNHGLDLTAEPVRHLVEKRVNDPLFTSGSVRVVQPAGDAAPMLSFVYKAAAEIGELGDNTKALRAAMFGDRLLQLALQAPTARLALLGHTRWASVGIISEPNAHPLNHEEEGHDANGPYVVAALNGDVDNHADLKATHSLRISAPITTDAKVIPALVSRAAAGGATLTEAFRRTVASFEGSVAIGAAGADDPERVYLALRGSGQALYIGLAEDAFIVASEPYGVVEETARFVRMDGETPADVSNPASRGQVLVLDGRRAGELGGIERIAYDGTVIPVTDADVHVAEVTTRDIDRGSAPHFLLKEITEAPSSFAKTLRGRLVERDGRTVAEIGARAMPAEIATKLADGTIKRIEVIGQGTAAVAGRSMAEVLGHLLAGSHLVVRPITATEYSGFAMRSDLTDTLVVAVSQSGTTTDTNRTVDLARGRGASVIGIVNRRNSDLTDKAHGVLYTSDGRDVEMSVASTKAFYAQVAAGVLLSCAIAEAAGVGNAAERSELLGGLRELPDAMRTVLGTRPVLAEAARRYATQRRYWAVVGNGPNKVAAEEVRIKLSELCYKSIACDVTEDKKHIDLSAEPMILVCAAGLSGGTADDVAKEVAIYRAHKAAPIVIATEGEERFNAALQVVNVPAVQPRLAFVLSSMVGHLFGYEAALAIDALALPLREARELIEHAVGRSGADESTVNLLRSQLVGPTQRFTDGLRAGAYDGVLEASTAVRVTAILRDATAPSPLEAYQTSQGKVASPLVLVDDLTSALTRSIEELTRPIDAIKHQAKTVTVGISRSDEGLLGNRLVREVLTAGAARERLGYRVLKELVALDPAVESVVGFTRYAIEGDPTATGARAATIAIVDRGGIGRELTSRVELNPELRGTKRRVALDHEVLVARGRADGRTVLLVPEVKGNQTTGLTLLHVRFVPRLPAGIARSVLEGYRERYQLLADWVTETESAVRDDILASIDTVDLLTLPVTELANHWRS